MKRVAWLVVVDRSGECVDGCPTKKLAVQMAGEFSVGCEPASPVRVEYEWPPKKRMRRA